METREACPPPLLDQAASGIRRAPSDGGVVRRDTLRQSSHAKMRQSVIDTVEMKHQMQNTLSTIHSPYLRRIVNNTAGMIRASSSRVGRGESACAGCSDQSATSRSSV